MKEVIEAAWSNRELLKETKTQDAIREIIEQLDKGKVRVAEPTQNGWQVNEWVKKAVILYFPIQKMETMNPMAPDGSLRRTVSFCPSAHSAASSAASSPPDFDSSSGSTSSSS